MKNKAIFSQNLLWNFMSLGFLAFAGLFLNYIIGRFYGPEILGLFNIVFALYIFFSQFAVLGQHLSLLRYLSEGSNYSGEQNKIISAGLLLVIGIGLIVTLIALCLTPLLSYFFKSVNFALAFIVICPALLFFALNKALLNIINAYEHMRAFAFFQSLRFIFILLGLATALYFNLAGHLLSVIFPVSEAILCLFLLWYVNKSIEPIKVTNFKAILTNREWLNKHLNFGLKVFPSGLVVELNSRVDILLLGIILDEKQAGFYSIPLLLTEGLMQLIFVIRANINPHLSKLYFNHTMSELSAFMKKIAFLTFALFTLAATVLFIGFYFLLPMLFTNNSYAITLPLLLILLICAALASPLQPFSMLFSQTHHPALQTKYSLYVVGFNLCLNFVLITYFGLMGAAFATGLTFIFNSLLIAYLSKKYVLEK